MPTNDQSRSPEDQVAVFRIVNKLVNVFIIGAVLYFLAFIASVLLPIFSPESDYQALNQISTLLFNQGSSMIDNIWTFIRPILQFIIIIVLLRLLLFSSTSPISSKFSSVIADVPSLIAVIVIGTLCLLPLLTVNIPDALGNIALVIVGFYFGRDRRLRTETIDISSGQSTIVEQVTEPTLQGNEPQALNRSPSP